MKQLNGVRLDYQYRDFWGEYIPKIADQLDAIETAGCYQPRWYHAPSSAEQTLAPNGNLRYILEIPAGSYVLGIKHNIAAGFMVNVTDIGINHDFFMDPIPDAYLLAGDTPTENPGQLTYWFSGPHPVTPPGRFLVEFWNSSPSEETNIELVLLVAEVTQRTGVPTNGNA